MSDVTEMTAEQLEELANGLAAHLHSEETIQHLARRVLAAEKLVEALGRIANGPWHEGMETPEDQTRFDHHIAQSALTAYRESSK